MKMCFFSFWHSSIPLQDIQVRIKLFIFFLHLCFPNMQDTDMLVPDLLFFLRYTKSLSTQRVLVSLNQHSSTGFNEVVLIYTGKEVLNLLKANVPFGYILLLGISIVPFQHNHCLLFFLYTYFLFEVRNHYIALNVPCLCKSLQRHFWTHI